MSFPPRPEGPSPSDTRPTGVRPPEPSFTQSLQDRADGEGSWPVYPSDSDAASDRFPLRYGIIAIVAVVVIAVIVVGVGIWSTTAAPKTSAAAVWTAEPAGGPTTIAAPSPTPAQSGTAVGNCVGSSARTSGWEALVPAGWSCQYVAGREVFVMDDTYDTIDVTATYVGPGSACTREHLFQGTSSVTTLPHTSWGHHDATTVGFKYQSWIGQARCVYANGFTYVMLGTVLGGTLDKVVQAESALADAWVWKA